MMMDCGKVRASSSVAIVFAIVLFASVTVRTAEAQNIANFLQNKELVNKEIGCVLQRLPCDVIGRQIRAVLPEALNNNCARCTPQQAQIAKELMSFMGQNYPNEWAMIQRMYGRSRNYY